MSFIATSPAFAEIYPPVNNSSAPSNDVAGGRLLRPGHNCWTLSNAPSASVLVDAKEYFWELEKALRTAQHAIVILGWDFDGRIRLCPDGEGDCETLGDLLRSLVESNPDLHVHVLVWSVAIAHAPGASLPLLLGADWDNHPRIDVRLDTEHPIYAAHHQKVVCIDDAVAFAGGMDLTVSRWDTNDHEAAHDCRVNPDGDAYGPVHDVQVMVNGETARHLATLARERWRRATGDILPVRENDEARWPTETKPDFRGVDIGISRTMPAWRGEDAVEEIAELTIDAIKAARRSIYIEAQYLTCAEITKVLAERLQEPDGPEIVAVCACNSHGLMERLIMGNNRDRLIRHLRQVDQYDRLRVMFPAIGEDEAKCEILIHAKVMVIDDRFLRIGSANLNNRSRGLDTECDLTIEATDDTQRQGIAAIRDRLLAEHLGTKPSEVTRCIADGSSLIGCIDSLNTGRRHLCAFDALTCGDGPCEPMFGTSIMDPARPISLV